MPEGILLPQKNYPSVPNTLFLNQGIDAEGHPRFRAFG